MHTCKYSYAKVWIFSKILNPYAKKSLFLHIWKSSLCKYIRVFGKLCLNRNSIEKMKLVEKIRLIVYFPCESGGLFMVFCIVFKAWLWCDVQLGLVEHGESRRKELKWLGKWGQVKVSLLILIWFKMVYFQRVYSVILQ